MILYRVQVKYVASILLYLNGLSDMTSAGGCYRLPKLSDVLMVIACGTVIFNYLFIKTNVINKLYKKIKKNVLGVTFFMWETLL